MGKGGKERGKKKGRKMYRKKEKSEIIKEEKERKERGK